MDKERLKHQFNDLEESIRCLYKAHRIIPLLILSYSYIDILSWLDLPNENQDVSKKDFIKWTDKYIEPQENLQCTSQDLYAARCSIVHSYSATSYLSRSLNAKEIYYVWGEKDIEILDFEIKQGNYNAIAMRLEKLIYAIICGSEKFLELRGDDDMVLKRAGKFFVGIHSLE